MKTNVVIFGKAYTTSYIFIHVLQRLLDRLGGRPDSYHFHLILDDRRDSELAAPMLRPERVTIHSQYQTLEPFREDRSWPEEIIEQWEQKYGSPNLRAYMNKERMLEGRPESEKWRYLLSHIEYFESLFRQTTPALYISGAADALPPWAAMEVFRRNGVPCLVFSPARFGYQSFIIDNPYEVLKVGQLYKTLRKRGLDSEERNAAMALVERYRAKQVKPADHMAVRANVTRLIPNPLKVFPVFKSAVLSDAKNYDLPLGTIVSRSLSARLTGLYNLYLSRKTFTQVDGNHRFFFFPLHYEPEMSLITNGRGWTDQLELIRLISDCLPLDRWLYVKEHPSMLTGHRSLRFYKDILALPRVRLLDQYVDSYRIVPQAEAVLTVTGTAGWEALMFGRPVVLFGRCFYEEFDEGVIRVDRPDDLPHILLAVQHRQVEEEALLAYIVAVLSKTRGGMFIEPRFYPQAEDAVMSEENLDNIARVIVEKLDEMSAGTPDSAFESACSS